MQSLRAFPLYRFAVMAIFLIALPQIASAAQCGTARLFDPSRPRPIVAFKSGNFGRTSTLDARARTLESAHFQIHYSLHGLHKVRTGPEDSIVTQTADSLYGVFAALTEAKRDSTVYARLDAMDAPHPIFVQKVKEYLEAAWNYYVVTLGMKSPMSTIASVQYKVPFMVLKKFPVDIVDVGTADREFFGETYAVTYPPDNLSITFENDFLWNTRLDSDGRIVGQSIKSQVAGKVLHDYADEWEFGIKVTAFHEFYHAIQFTYNPRVATYHAWYEISAVGMEERNAPEVNDYFQYLPCVLKNHDRIALTALGAGPCTHSPVYGNGIFHLYLSQALDNTFDVKVWEELARNGDDLRKGLEFAFSKYGKTMADLYSDYAGQLLFSGGGFHLPAGLFSTDIPQWPSLGIDSLDMRESMAYRLLKLPPLTFMVLKVTWSNNSALKILQAKGVNGLTGTTRIHTDLDSTVSESMSDVKVTLGPPLKGFKDYFLVIPNASFSDTAFVELKEPEAAFYAFPNPVHLTSASLYFSQAKGMQFPAGMEIFGEDGTLLRELRFTSGNAVLTWDLRDENSETVKPGLYYYRLEKEKLRPLLILR